MLPLRKHTQRLTSVVQPLAVSTLLVLAGLLVTLFLPSPVRAAVPAQAAESSSGTRPGMMESSAPVSPTMSMAEMGAMMQMMSMMHQKMGQMMGEGMMGEGMMNGGSMAGLENEKATPETAAADLEATIPVEPSATAVITESTESSKPEATTGDSGHPDPALATTSQTATAGAITVGVKPLDTDELLDIAFDITLETHSVELAFDLAERATLTVGEFSFPATSWEPNAPGGHHVEGTLRFTIDHPAHAALADVNAVTLELQDIDEQLVTLTFAVE